MFELPELPFEKDALEPMISAETIEYHHGKHHQAYITNLNKLASENDMLSMSLEDIISSSK
jgi:Fe-Mn family superoxide dismutase